jgi:GH25 family lysozyme M1 (1,4-beta-N-acetylmuramidase)
MLDLSNNNARGHDFKTAYAKGGQRRLYLKRCQGVGFVDKTYPELRTAALAAGFHVGAYDFLEPGRATPHEAAQFFLELLGPVKPGRDLRPCLDCEHGAAGPAAGKWITATAKILTVATGVKPLIYGSAYWLEACRFPAAPGPLWLAAYGRNDGREYPIGKLPAPWKVMAAHQYASTARVVGIKGTVDISHVFVPSAIEITGI